MAPVIEVRNLRKTYRDIVAVDDVSFEVEQGEIMGILGPNGAGKTTTVECLQGLRSADGGQMRILGLDPQSQAGELRPKIGAQLQQAALPDHLKVWEALDLFSSFVPGATDWRDLLRQWGLVEKRNAAFASLSGGQRQRLFVALALVNDPEVVFLDEMTTGLDPQARRVAWDLILAIRARGATVVLVTHSMDEAERLCDRLLVIDHGHVVASGTPEELVTNHPGDVRMRFTSETDVAWLEEVRGVVRVERHGSRVTVHCSNEALPLAIAALVQHGEAPVDLRVDQPGLEEVYLSFVGHEDAA